MVLSNLTSSSQTCVALLSLQIQVVPLASTTASISYYPIQSRAATCPAPVPHPSIEPLQVHALPLLVQAFVEGVSPGSGLSSERIRKGYLHFLSSVFANISAVRATKYSCYVPATVSYSSCVVPVAYRKSLLSNPESPQCSGTRCPRISPFQDHIVH